MHKKHPHNHRKRADTQGGPAPPQEPASNPAVPHSRHKVILLAVGGVTLFTLTIIFPQIISHVEYYLATGYYGHHFLQLFRGK